IVPSREPGQRLRQVRGHPEHDHQPRGPSRGPPVRPRLTPSGHREGVAKMSIATDVRAYADAALEQGKTALTQATATVTTVNKRLVEDAPKPAFAAVGAADLVAETVTKRVEALPAEAVASVSKVQESSKAAIAKAQADAIAKVA